MSTTTAHERDLALTKYERELMALLTALVGRRFDEARARGVPADIFADIASIARAMTAALPSSHVYDQLVGPFYDTRGMVQWRGVTRQAINKATRGGKLIACQLDGGTWVYPTWQFTDTGAVNPKLLALWSVLHSATDPWTCAVWLRSPQPELEDQTAVDWITDNRPLDIALSVARADTERWTT